jgi:hypothetical protein
MVDSSAQPKLVTARPRNSAGIALPAAIGALTALAVLLAGLLVIVDLNAKTSTNRRSAVRAVQVAEAGASHALGLLRGSLAATTYTGLLRGSDGVAGTADDGMLTGYGLPADDQIPAGGRAVSQGTYFVSLVDDPADPVAAAATDGNNRLLLTCQGSTPDGGSAEVRVVVGSTPFPGIVTDGTLTISGNPQVYGPCGSIHANDDVIVSGNPNVAGTVSASDTVRVSGSITDSAGKVTKKPLSNQPPIEIPPLKAADYCADADYILEADGDLIEVGPPMVQFDADKNEVHGWKSDGKGKWDVSGNSMTGGTYCVTGNVHVSGNPSKANGDALPLTILATGSVEFSGNPKITPDHPDGVAVIAGGDLQISGDVSYTGQTGVFYARSQCQLNGNPTIYGQVICDNEPNAAGTTNFVSENKVNGNPVVIYDCDGLFGGKRRVLSWFQQLGT